MTRLIVAFCNKGTDFYISMGLVLVLIINTFQGGATELQNYIVAGLIGYMGRLVKESRDPNSRERRTDGTEG